MTRRGLLLRLLCLVPAALLAVVCFRLWTDRMNPQARGLTLNEEAFAASFTERGLPVPRGGPREGYWGSRMKKKVLDDRLGWREAEDHAPGRIEVDGSGCQQFRPSGATGRRVLVLGGSVAWGAYASAVDRTYFELLGRKLESEGVAAEVTVLAAGAWKSHQDVRGLGVRLEDGHRYDLVVFLDGLNDLTNGPTADTLYNGAPVSTLAPGVSSDMPGEFGHVEHSGDFPARVEAYLVNMARAADLARSAGAEMVVALQPSLYESDRPTKLESRLRESAVRRYGAAGALRDCYAAMRAGLAELARRDGVTFLDLSRLFAEEGATTFVDIWHFTDPGHRLVADRLAAVVGPLLRQR